MISEDKAILVERMAKNLPPLRMRLGLSQEELGQMLGIGKGTIGAIENHKREMSWELFLAVFCIFQQNAKSAMLLKPMDLDPEIVTRCLQVDEWRKEPVKIKMKPIKKKTTALIAKELPEDLPYW